MTPACEADPLEATNDRHLATAQEPERTSLIVVHCPAKSEYLGRHLVLDPAQSDLTIGRHTSNTFVFDVEGLSRRHARFERLADMWWVLDSKSTNGTRVNGAPVQEAILHDGDTLQLGGSLMFRYYVGNLGEFSGGYCGGVQYTSSVRDGITGLYNRRYFSEALEREMMRARQQTLPLSLLLLDLDWFKKLNDVHGHLVGDRLLQQLGKLLERHVRAEVVVARYGGEEFAVLLPGTDLPAARALAEVIRAEIAAHPFVGDGQTLTVTASVGVAVTDAAMREPMDLVRASDDHLFEAKRGGRNRVCG